MRPKAILVFALFLVVRAACQEVPQHSTDAQCSFSDGSKITVTYSLEQKGYRLVTDGSLVTVKGVHVPAGDYAVTLAKDSANNWTLTMKKTIMEKGLWVLPPLPMSAATASPVNGFPVFFGHTGGSCMMYWSEKKSGTVLSLEFTKENADLPVAD